MIYQFAPVFFAALVLVSCRQDFDACEIQVEDLTTPEDVEGNLYSTFTTANLIWFNEDLRVTKFRNGDTIPRGKGQSVAQVDGNSSITGNYSHDILYYGLDAISDPRGLCPCGWRLPSKRDFDELRAQIEVVKERDGSGIQASQEAIPGGSLTNSNGQREVFDVDFLGYVSAVTGTIESSNKFSYYWSADCGPLGCDVFVFEKGGYEIKNSVGIRGYGFSVRCVTNRR